MYLPHWYFIILQLCSFRGRPLILTMSWPTWEETSSILVSLILLSSCGNAVIYQSLAGDPHSWIAMVKVQLTPCPDETGDFYNVSQITGLAAGLFILIGVLLFLSD